MNKEITVERLGNKHAKQIADLILTIQQEEFNLPISLDDQPDLLDIESSYSASGGGFWGVFNKEELVGTIALISLGHNAGAIRKMFVKKEFRGKEFNIAKGLLDGLISYCKDYQINDLYLGTVDVLKAAHKFYERNDFVKIDKQDLPGYFPRMNLDSLFYHLHLKSLPI